MLEAPVDMALSSKQTADDIHIDINTITGISTQMDTDIMWLAIAHFSVCILLLHNKISLRAIFPIC